MSTRSAVTDNCELAFAQWHPDRGKMSYKARLDKPRPTAASTVLVLRSTASLTCSYNSRNDSFGATFWVFLDLMLPDPNHVPSHSA